MAYRKKSSGTFNLTGQFLSSVNRMGESSSWLTAFIFLAGGAFSIYIGYGEHYIPTLLGGPVAVLIGLIICYKAWSMHREKAQRKKRKSLK
jgi:hypothetical protein